ncbi:MAG: phage integrase N-terminal SAM-like domain-containing protein [Acidovorax sp.]|nr:phage integrase N-terminal SAM-like domain-containing protein [Acidovorax sp.]
MGSPIKFKASYVYNAGDGAVTLCKKHRHKIFTKPGTPVLRSTRLLDQVRERIRSLHYSLSTQTAYLHRVRYFIRWHGRGGVIRHPREMGAAEVDAFLTVLATERRVSAHNQALSTLLFLSREVLGVDLACLDGANRPAQKRRIPSVLIPDEVTALFQFLDSDMLERTGPSFS